GHAGTVRALAFAQEGRLLASGGADRSVRLWDMQEGRSIGPPIVDDDAVTSIAWSADGRTLVYGSKDKSFRVLDPRSSAGAVRVRRDDDAVELVTFLPDTGELATVSKDAGVRLWKLATLERPPMLADRGNVLSLAFDPSTDRLMSAG